MTIIYSFKGTRSEKILEYINSRNKYILSRKSLNKSLDKLITPNTDYLIGLGDYSGKDTDKVRIETVCKNQFRNDKIIPSEQKTNNFKISDFLKVGENTKLTTAMGNSYCNYSCYFLSYYIKTNDLKTKLGFLHIPKNIESETVNNYIINYINKTG